MTVSERWKAFQSRHGLVPDGKPGIATISAVEKLEGVGPMSVKPAPGRVDARSAKHLKTLLPEVQPVFKAHLQAAKKVAKEWGVVCKIISGTRSWTEQDKLYAQGRTAPGNIVTKARGGYSNHNYQIAVDYGLFDKGEYLGDSDPKKSAEIHREIAKKTRSLGLEWGGDWKSITDLPHWQYPTGLTTAQMRARVKAGKPIV